MTRDEAELFRVRIDAALAEAGYPGAVTSVEPHWGYDNVFSPGVFSYVPDHVQWTASLISGASVSCWPCWQAKRSGQMDRADKPGCEHDPWTSERPNLRRAS